ncbi:MAG: radical SAM protein [Bacteroidetes bacterium GWF2_38_335]|nr:MAG: radical SAM protein [Bacteroidetes bacterium GWF2_38_335]OFY81491.1 MAG: radical SAM protein [Bacteroidetes bacterium RIFOXYA12_FULL_38_20]HBS87657.1 radical SAM protein [Bacteroidales bacterium]
MLDRYNRKINYLRISVTDRCNLRCTYCMPADGVSLLSHNEVLSFEEIIVVVKEAVRLGIDKIRITGGEPLVRKGISSLVKMIAEVQGVRDLAMTTNGILLEKFAEDLADAGLQRVNVSLDTMSPQRFYEITRGGNISDVLKGIEAAKKAGLSPVKINCVVNNTPDEEDARAVAEYCHKNGLDIRYIHMMDLNAGKFSVVEGGDGGNCKTCNRLRLTANGKIMPCLFSDKEIDVRSLGAENAIKKAIEQKPECGSVNNDHHFYNIGG